MLLQEAIEQLELGKSVRRAAWPMSEGYLKLLDGVSHIWKIVTTPTPNAGNYIFSHEDLKADDWCDLGSINSIQAAPIEVTA
jgi:hypothetical protein